MNDRPITYIMFSSTMNIHSQTTVSGRIYIERFDDILPINNIDYRLFCRCFKNKYNVDHIDFYNIPELVDYIYDAHENKDK